MATTNTSAATATVIKGWSTTVQNFSDLGAPPYNLWFRVHAGRERARIWHSCKCSIRQLHRAAEGHELCTRRDPERGNRPVTVFPTPGSPLYFKVSIAGTSLPNVPFSLVLVQAPTGTAPAGSILINDVTDWTRRRSFLRLGTSLDTSRLGPARVVPCCRTARLRWKMSSIATSRFTTGNYSKSPQCPSISVRTGRSART